MRAILLVAAASAAAHAATFPAVIELSTLDGTNGFALLGAADFDSTGQAVAPAGDLNADGFDDLIIGASAADTTATLAGDTYVVFGGPGVGSPADIDLGALDGTDGFVINGVAFFDFSGYSVSPAGDVNADTYDDILIGAYYAAPNGRIEAGESYIIFGGPSVGASGSLALSDLDGSDGFRLVGVDAADRSGTAVTTADLNNDTHPDIVIGAPYASPDGRLEAGETYVVFGGPGVGASGAIELSTLNGANGFVINGVAQGDLAGAALSAGADFNHDGVDDLLLGAPFANGTGAAYVLFGDDTLGASGAIELSTLTGADGFALTGVAPDDNAGIAVASLADVNADTIDDLIIGASSADPGAIVDAGESYVVFGKDTALAGPFPPAFDLATLNGTNGYTITGVATGDLSGFSVASPGDINNDTVNDILIGALLADPGARTDAGAAYAVFGGATVGASGSLNLASLDGSNGFTINGVRANDLTAGAVAPAGDVNADNIDDILIGASLAAGATPDAGAAYVVFGAAGTPCPADLTTQGAGPGDPGFGVPDGLVTGADINFYVNAWVAGDPAIADVTTQGAGPADPGFGVPDGLVTGADINYYVNLWVAGCP
jgi:hypothetical protein